MIPARRRSLTAAIRLGVAVVALLALQVIGDGALAGPPLAHPMAWAAWARADGPGLTVVAVLRIGLMAVGWYLVAVAVLGILSVGAGHRALRRGLQALAPRSVRQLALAGLGLSVAGLAVTPGTSYANPATVGPAPPVLHVVGGSSTDPANAPTPAPTTTPTTTGPPVLRQVGVPGSGTTAPSPPTTTPTTTTPARPTTTTAPPASTTAPAPAPTTPRTTPTTTTTTPTSPPATAAPSGTEPATPPRRSIPSPSTPAAIPAPSPPTPAAGTWTIRPGDDLWSVAETALADAWGHPPDERSVAAYWWLLVQTNRAHLPDPANPSLVFPGDVIQLPPAPPAPS